MERTPQLAVGARIRARVTDTQGNPLRWTGTIVVIDPYSSVVIARNDDDGLEYVLPKSRIELRDPGSEGGG